MAADEIVKKVAMFLVGFTILAAFLLALSCANYSIKRFQLPVERVGLFINITKNTMELAGFIAVLIGNIIIWLSKGKGKEMDSKNIPKICSLFTNWLMFVMSILSLVAYKSGGDSGNLKFYFWTIVSHVFVCAINFVFSVKVDPGNVSYIYVGQQLFSIFVSVYHNIFLYFANKYEMDNIDYWIVYGQIVIMIIFTCATALLWTYSTYSENFEAFISCIKSKLEDKGSPTSPSCGAQEPSSPRVQEPSSSCCCCCKKCSENCKKSCTTPCTGGQGCTCCQENKCCCCCKEIYQIEYDCICSLSINTRYQCVQKNESICCLLERYTEELSCDCTVKMKKECKCTCCTTSGDSESVSAPQKGGTSGAGNGKGSIWDEFKKPLLWSPAMIFIFANGTIYSVYPGVSPYQLVSADVGYKIGLINLLLSPIIPIAICILDIYCLGPSKKWENGYVGWHALWAGPIYAIICIILFFYTLHYPESMIGRNIYGNNVLVGLLTVSYVVVQEGLEAVGQTATNSQVDNEEHKGTVTTIIHLISLVLSNIFMFIGDGYLQTFRKYSRDNWPTKGYTRYRGFKFWLGSACKVAGKSILNVFNSDIRSRIESFS